MPSSSSERAYLFIDDAFLASSRNVTFEISSPRKTGEHNLVADRPWERFYAGGWNTVLDDGGKVRMWYEASVFDGISHVQKVCYAESGDGIHFTKPTLGLVEFEGSRDNNILGINPARLTRSIGAVFLDPRLIGGTRFKYIGREVTNPRGATYDSSGLWIFGSPDGIHWKPLVDRPVMDKPGSYDSQNQAFFDHRLGRYVAYVRLNPFERTKFPKQLRRVGRCESEDLIHWTDPEIVFASDAHDPEASDHYNSCVMPCDGAPDVYFMFPSAINNLPPVPGEDRVDIQLAASRDGRRWNRFDRRPYLRLGMEGAFDAGSMYMSLGMIRRGPEIWMYYTGYPYAHSGYDVRNTRYAGVVSRLVQRVDGFVSANAGEEPGELLTQPLPVRGDQLLVNVDTGALGQLRLELAEENGAPIPGFSMDACRPVKGNSVARALHWKENTSVARLIGRPVRLRFSFERAKLYSFRM